MNEWKTIYCVVYSVHGTTKTCQTHFTLICQQNRFKSNGAMINFIQFDLLRLHRKWEKNKINLTRFSTSIEQYTSLRKIYFRRKNIDFNEKIKKERKNTKTKSETH